MKNFWSLTIALITVTGLLAQQAVAQQSQRDSRRPEHNQQRQTDEMDDDEAEDEGDRDDDRYTTQYGSDDSRTSRDYSLDRNNEYATERSNRPSQRRSPARGNRPAGASRDESDFDQDNNDAPHSSTRTDRRNRFDDETSRFEDDEYSSRSYQPRGDRSARRTENSTHDYAEGVWSRAFRSRDRSSNQTNGDADESSDSDNQTWAEWWSSRTAGSDETHGEGNERFAAGADEFIRQHDEDEDTYLSRREMPRGMLENFHDLDTDGDDYLSREELHQHGRTMQQVASSESSPGDRTAIRVMPMEVTYLWIMDTDRGQVRLNHLQGAYELLQRIDANNDGNITRSELRDRRQHVVSRWIEHGFDRLDENEDDAISRSEAEQSMLQERFDRLDANQDGELTRSELRQSAEQASESWGPPQDAADDETYLSEGQDPDDRR